MTPIQSDTASAQKFTHLELGELQDFHKGLESIIVIPEATNAWLAMEREHMEDNECHSCNPRHEWDIVLRGEQSDLVTECVLTQSRKKGRDIRHDLDHYVTISQQLYGTFLLTKAEVAGLRLWTGPMFVRYAELLRKRNDTTRRKYVTTLHAINSGITKLSRLWKLPKNRKVYRGYNNISLPENFTKKDVSRCCGGVEPCVLATTEEWDTALFYSEKSQKHDNYATSVRVIFEIEVSQVDRGADISWLSQYPDEKEVLFNALSNLELVVKQHKLFTDQGPVVVYPVRISANLRSKTLEEFSSMRKDLHLHIVQYLVDETERHLRQLPVNKPCTGGENSLGAGDEFLDDIKPHICSYIDRQCQKILQKHEETKNEDFNDLGNHIYMNLVKEADAMKTLAEKTLVSFCAGFPWQGNEQK